MNLNQTLHFLKNYFTSSQKDLELFLRKHRIQKYQDITTTRIPWWRTPVHYVLVGVLVLIRLLAKRKVIVISDKRRKTKEPVIYACTHIGAHDVESTFEAIKSPGYLFMGMPGKSTGQQMGLCYVSMA